LQQRKGPLATYLPCAVGDGGRHTLYICQASGMTSLLKPDPRMLAVFHPFLEFVKILATETIPTRQLDTIAEITALDLLHIDAQGSELAILRSARQKLANAVAVQSEVSFLPLYENQPIFSEIDQELRSQGFIPHAFVYIKHWPIAPAEGNDARSQAAHQLLEGDLVYVRDFTRPDSLSDEQLKHLALIAHYCYGSYDLARRCLGILEQRGSLEKGAQERYRPDVV
jgi:hypothetical protein